MKPSKYVHEVFCQLDGIFTPTGRPAVEKRDRVGLSYGMQILETQGWDILQVIVPEGRISSAQLGEAIWYVLARRLRETGI